MRTKQILICAVFGAVLVLLAAALVLLPAQTLSTAERRALAQLEPYSEWTPDGGQEKTLSGYFSRLETVFLDQFPLRQRFRQLRSFAKQHLFFQRDSGGYYAVDGSIAKLAEPLDEAAVQDALSALTKLDESLFSQARRYYAVIPDKGYYLSTQNGSPTPAYAEISAMADAALEAAAQKIDLTALLSAQSYYATDPHWRQETLLSVADAILTAMQAEPLASGVNWQSETLSPFYGAYYGHSAIATQPDALTVLRAPEFDAVRVLREQSGEKTAVYVSEEFAHVDGYDVFLGGAQALVRIENPAQSNGRQLVVLRDSFASSLVPLLIPAYSRITLVDIRYVSPRLLPSYLDLTQQTDALYLYSMGVLNSFGAFMR